MNILLVEDDEDIRELLALIFETKLRASVLQAGTAQAALELLKGGHSFDCIFSDYHLPDGNSGSVYKCLNDMNLAIPFILCSSESPDNLSDHFKKRKISAFIPKPFDTRTILDVVTQVLTPQIDQHQKGLQSEYCPIKLRTLLKANVIACDLFVKLSESKYVRLIQAGDSFGKDEYQRFTDKKLDCLYVHSNDAGLFLERFARDTLSLSRVKSLPQKEAFEVSKLNHEMVQQALSSLGLTPEIQALIESCTNLAIRTISNDPVVLPYFQKLWTFKKQQFLSTHSILMVQISCYLAYLLGWTSESTQYKLTLAAFLHDITIPTEEIAMTELDSSVTHPDFEKHPLDVMKLVQLMKGSPNDVDSIVMHHHERPNGSGFPNHLKASQIGPLPSLFIVAHDLANYLWLRDTNASLQEFLELFGDEYSQENFKKIKLELIKANENYGTKGISPALPGKTNVPN